MAEVSLATLGVLPDPGTPRWNHIGTTVRDMDRSIEFWCHHFDFELLADRAGKGGFLEDLLGMPDLPLRAAFLRAPGQSLLLELVQYLPPYDAVPDAGVNTVGAGHLGFWVDDIDSLVHSLSIDGAEMISKSIVTITGGPLAGGRSVYMRAPDGFTLELHEPNRANYG